jgi:hypothetical protein
MTPLRPAVSSSAFLAALFIAFTALTVCAGDAGLPPNPKDAEKPKEPEFKHSAWCAFRDLSAPLMPVPIEDPKKPSEHTRIGSTSWSGFGRRGMWTSIVLEMKNTTEKTEFKGTTSIRIEPLTGDGSGTNRFYTTYACCAPKTAGPRRERSA